MRLNLTPSFQILCPWSCSIFSTLNVKTGELMYWVESTQQFVKLQNIYRSRQNELVNRVH